jgi:hypothetical protein
VEIRRPSGLRDSLSLWALSLGKCHNRAHYDREYSFSGALSMVGGDGSAACPVRAIQSLGRFGSLTTDVRVLQRTWKVCKEGQVQMQFNRRSSALLGALHIWEETNLTACCSIAGGSGIASTEAITSNAQSTKTM